MEKDRPQILNEEICKCYATGSYIKRLNTVPVGNIRKLEGNEVIQEGDFLEFLTIEDYEEAGEELTDLVEKFAGEIVEVLKISKDTNEWGEKVFLVVNADGDIVSATSHEFSQAYREKEI